MSEKKECFNNCKECGSNCTERREPQSLIEQTNKNSNVKKVIGIVSGKGGVGKSLVTSDCRNGKTVLERCVLG